MGLRAWWQGRRERRGEEPRQPTTIGGEAESFLGAHQRSSEATTVSEPIPGRLIEAYHAGLLTAEEFTWLVFRLHDDQPRRRRTRT